jgi:hypothetical protein
MVITGFSMKWPWPTKTKPVTKSKLERADIHRHGEVFDGVGFAEADVPQGAVNGIGIGERAAFFRDVYGGLLRGDGEAHGDVSGALHVDGSREGVEAVFRDAHGVRPRREIRRAESSGGVGDERERLRERSAGDFHFRAYDNCAGWILHRAGQRVRREAHGAHERNGQ